MPAPSRRGRWAACSALLLLVTACGGPQAGPSSEDTPAPTAGSPTAGSPTATAGSATPTASGEAAAVPPVAPDAELQATDVATGLEVPWGIAVFQDGSVLVSERDSGRILRIRDGQVQELGTVDAVPSSEGGLLGVELAPDESYVYAYYSTRSSNQLVRFPYDGSTLGAEEVLLTDIPMAGIHNGGQVRFGPDGMLYVATGDASRRGDAQDPQSLAGKILRLTPEGEPAPGNAWGNEVFTIGHRNVQGLAWDDQGRMWASEFGQNTWDELNLIESGKNYGWPEVEGARAAEGMTQPARVWDPADASPSGLAWWRGSLWMASLRGNTLWQIPVEASGGTGEPVARWEGEYGRLRAVGAADDAGPLLVGTSNRDGRGTPRSGDDRLLRVE